MEPEGSLPHSQTPACQLDSVHAPKPHFLKMHLSIILPSTPGTSKWSFSLTYPHQNPVYTFIIPIRATCPAHLILLDLITRTITGEQNRSLTFNESLHFIYCGISCDTRDVFKLPTHNAKCRWQCFNINLLLKFPALSDYAGLTQRHAMNTLYTELNN